MPDTATESPHSVATVAAVYDALFEDFLPHKARFWERVGTAPLQVTTDAVLDHHCDAERLKIIDVGCGTGVEVAGFPEWIKAQGYDGAVECIGCDVSEKMVEQCREGEGLNVRRDDFRQLKPWFGQGHLVWRHFSLIHVPFADFPEQLQDLWDLCIDGGIVGIGFKTGNDEERIDPAEEESLDVDRFTAFHRPQTMRSHLEEAGLNWITTVERQSPGDSYTYCWMLARKPE